MNLDLNSTSQNKKESLYDSTRKVFFSHYNERIFSFKKTYYLKLFEDTDNNPDISVWISCLLIDDYKDIILLQEDACSKLKDINESLINESLNKKEAIYRLIDEVPELFIKINNAISLDIMNIWGLIKNQKFEEDKDTDFISLLGFNSDLDNMNTYNKFLEYSISLIRSINRSIVDDGFAQNIKERIFYKIMSSELFKNTEIETDIQIAHFVVFTNDKTIKKEFFNYNFNSDNIFVEVIVPIECYNACSYKEPSEKTDM